MRNTNEVVKHGTKILVKNNDVGRALRKLKKRIQSERIMQDYQEKRYYEKPSAVRKRKKAQARKRWLKKLAENQNYI